MVTTHTTALSRSSWWASLNAKSIAWMHDIPPKRSRSYSCKRVTNWYTDVYSAVRIAWGLPSFPHCLIFHPIFHPNLEQQSLWNKNFPKFNSKEYRHISCRIVLYIVCLSVYSLCLASFGPSYHQYFGDFPPVNWTSRTPCAISFPFHLVASLAGVVCHHNPPITRSYWLRSSELSWFVTGWTEETDLDHRTWLYCLFGNPAKKMVELHEVNVRTGVPARKMCQNAPNDIQLPTILISWCKF